jgi:hypothetical protein
LLSRNLAQSREDFYEEAMKPQESSESIHGFLASLWICFWLRLWTRRLFALNNFHFQNGQRTRRPGST